MQFKKVAIIKNSINIGRIIPFNMDQGQYDFKISFSKNNYEVNMYHFLSKVPQKIKLDDITSWEISYHRSTFLKPTVIHLKEKKNDPEYKPLPLKRLVDPSLYNEFPIPFMRIEIPSNLQGKDYKSKPNINKPFKMYTNVYLSRNLKLYMLNRTSYKTSYFFI